MKSSSVPLEDVKYFFGINNYDIPINKREIYNVLDQILSNKDYDIIPLSISDFIIAKSLANKHIKTYDISDILFKNDDELLSLTRILQLPDINKERIIRILSYLGKLNTSAFDILPDETLRVILDELDCKSAFLFCKTNPKLKRFCNQNLLPSLQNNFIKQGLVVGSLSSARLTCEIRNRPYPTMTSDNFHLYVLVNNKIYKIRLVDNTDEEIEVDDTIESDNVGNILQIAIFNGYLYALNEKGLLYRRSPRKIFELVNGLTNVIHITVDNNFNFTTANGNTFLLNADQIRQIEHKGIIDKQWNIILKDSSVYYDNDLDNPILNNIKYISTGSDHYLALSNDNQVYSWGKNDYGQLGSGDQEDDYVPALISNLNDVTQVLAAKEISLFLMKTGDVYHCGRNLEEIILVPTKLSKVNNVVELYNMGNYPTWRLENYNIDQLGVEDNGHLNYQIARTKDNKFLVLIGELLYPIVIF